MFRKPRSRQWLFVVLGLGCGQADQITQYEVKKYELMQTASAKPAGQGTTPSTPTRVFGAMTARDKELWFFKLSGNPSAVGAQTEAIRTMLSQITFSSSGEPVWIDPEGWQREPGNQFRFATLKFSGPPTLELSITRLPKMGEDWLATNLNRWRNQIGLGPLKPDEVADATTTLPYTSGEFVIMDAEGSSTGGGMMPRGPFERPPSEAERPPTAARTEPPRNAGSVQLKYQSPEGWTEIPPSGFRKAAFEIAAGGKKGEVTVIDLDAKTNDRLANIKRWRQQVGLPNDQPEEILSGVRSIMVGDLKGDLIELTGKGEKGPTTILGVILEREDKMWFIKFTGDPELAAAEKNRFQEFAHSLRFQTP